MTATLYSAERVAKGELAVAWWPAENVRFIRLSSRPSRRDVELLMSVLTADVVRGAPRHASLVDVRALEETDTVELEAVPRWAAANREGLREKISASAIVHAGPAPAVAVLGYQRLADAPFPSRAFTSGPAALRWLGVEAADALWSGWERVVDREVGQDAVARVKRYLSGPLTGSLAAAAKALGLSSRSLQRALAQAGTSFRKLTDSERVERAQQLLRSPDVKLLAVAVEVGFAKVEDLNAAFRRTVGCTAAAWRART